MGILPCPISSAKSAHVISFDYWPLECVTSFRLRDERACPALSRILSTGSVRAKISAFVDDITVFVSNCLDILAVKMAVARYKQVAGAKVNFDKSEGLRLGVWKRSVPLPGPFRWSDGPVRILGVWFGLGLQTE